MIKINTTILLILFLATKLFCQENYSPAQLKAYQKPNGSEINLQWIAPQQNQFLSYSDTNTLSGFGFKEAKIVKVATKWEKDQLLLVNNMQINAVDFRLNSNKCMLTLKIWKGSNAQEELISQSVSDLSTENWNKVVLNQPITIDTNNTYWIGYEIDTKPGNTIGTDQGPFVEGVNMINTSGAWNPIEEIFPTVERNFQIRFYVDGDETNVPANGFNVYRNNERINSVLVTNSKFNDTLTQEGEFTYTVEAVYENDISEKSNEATVSFNPDIIKKDYVIIEKGTGTWCGWCPFAARAIDEMHANGKKVLAIAYHGNDQYEIPDGSGRITYYAMGGFPSVYLDGTSIPNVGSVEDWYQSLNQQYTQAIENISPYLIKPKMGKTDTGFVCQVSTSMLSESSINNLILHAVVTESHIDEAWQDMTELNDVARKMIPGVNGTQISFNENNESITNLNFNTSEYWNLNNSQLILFLQNKQSKEIIQATSCNLHEIMPAPYNVNVIIDTMKLEHKVQWNYSETEETSFNIYLINELIGNTNSKQFVIDTALLNSNETYKVGVEAINNGIATQKIESYFTAYKEIPNSATKNIHQNISVFPNPATNNIFIESTHQINKVAIFNMNGNLLIQKKDNCSSLDVSNLSQGIYILQITAKNTISNKKISIQ